MIKRYLILILTFFQCYVVGEKVCKNIWNMDNNVNGVSLYSVSLHMCTDGIINPSLDTTKVLMIDDLVGSIINNTNKTTNDFVNETNKLNQTNIAKQIQNVFSFIFFI